METITKLVASGGTHSSEESILLSKLVIHIMDYINAVSKHGLEFYNIPGAIDIMPNAKITKKAMANVTLHEGKMAYEYLFSDDTDSALSFLPTCEILHLNAKVIRTFLEKLTLAQAKKLWLLFAKRKKHSDVSRTGFHGNQWTKSKRQEYQHNWYLAHRQEALMRQRRNYETIKARKAAMRQGDYDASC
jgi:hypothetical protein